MSQPQGDQPLTRRQLRDRERQQQLAAAEPQLENPPASVLTTALVDPASVSVSVTVDPAVVASSPERRLTRRELRALSGAQRETADTAPSRTITPPQPASAESPSAAEAAVPRTPVASSAAATAHDRVTPVVPPPPTPPQQPRVASKQNPTAEEVTFTPPRPRLRSEEDQTFDAILSPDDLDPDDTHSRRVDTTGASVTANALIVPLAPTATDVTKPLDEAGKVTLTGSIALPRSFAETGQVPRIYDNADIDASYDSAEAPVLEGVSPVSAASAVSTTFTSQSELVAPTPAVRRNTYHLPIILASATGGVAVLVVGGLVVAGFVFHVF